jgi:FtsZ-interacting cell division protein ZipA
MCQVAQKLAGDMDGLITDDNGQQLTQNSMQIIERDLGHLYTALEQRDLAAGSAQARRLFS